MSIEQKLKKKAMQIGIHFYHAVVFGILFLGSFAVFRTNFNHKFYKIYFLLVDCTRKFRRLLSTIKGALAYI